MNTTRTAARLAALATTAVALSVGMGATDAHAANRTQTAPAAVQCDVDTNTITVTPLFAPSFEGQQGAYRISVWTWNGAWTRSVGQWNYVTTTMTQNEIFGGTSFTRPNGYHYISVEYYLSVGSAVTGYRWLSQGNLFTTSYTVLDRTVAMGTQAENFCRL